MTRLYTPEETKAIRNKVINNYALPIIKKAFERYPQLNSAYFTVAQYWSDNAYDELHHFILYSVLDTPDWNAFAKSEQAEDNCENWKDYDNSIKDPINLPGFVNRQDEMCGNSIYTTIEKHLYSFDGWKSEIIASFAAFSKEGSHQEMYYSEAYTPYALFTRSNEGIKVEIVGKMLRPWLDGIRPEEEF